MKSLKKNQLSELKSEMPKLDNKELLSIIGGDRYYFDQDGHYRLIPEQSNNDIIIIGNNQMTLSGSLNVLDSGNNSGVRFTGTGVSAELFTFLAQNTNVEWAYAFNSGEAGGLIGTSHQTNQVDLSSGNWTDYGTIAHNHGVNNDMSRWELEEYNGLPSQSDIEYLKKNNKQSGVIYNETTGEMCPYNIYSTTQEDWLREHGYWH